MIYMLARIQGGGGFVIKRQQLLSNVVYFIKKAPWSLLARHLFVDNILFHKTKPCFQFLYMQNILVLQKFLWLFAVNYNWFIVD